MPPDSHQVRAVVTNMDKIMSTVLVVLDGLDEAQEHVQDHLIDALLHLPFADLRVLCTSRELLKFEKKFQDCLQVEIRARDCDIETYTNAQIEQSDRLHTLLGADESLRQDILRTVIKKAAGM